MLVLNNSQLLCKESPQLSQEMYVAVAYYSLLMTLFFWCELSYFGYFWAAFQLRVMFVSNLVATNDIENDWKLTHKLEKKWILQKSKINECMNFQLEPNFKWKWHRLHLQQIIPTASNHYMTNDQFFLFNLITNL